jgi:tetratricopeptide (TPR) repeat protein
VVTDFGVAKAVSASSGKSSLTSLGVALGTPAYMAPEQAAADPHVDHRADIYAVGALAYEMLAGRTPFLAPTPQAMLAAHITQSVEPVVRHRPAVPPALNSVLMRCLEKRPADRWQTAAELLVQLEAVATPTAGLTPIATTPTGTMPISSGTEQAIRQSHPVRVALLFALASAMVLAVVYLLVHQLGLPDWVFFGAIVLLLIGLPIILITGYQERRRALARASGRVVTTPNVGLPAWFTWRKAIRGGVLAFAALGVVTVAYTAMRLLGIGPVGTLVASGRLSEKDRLVVADFENRTPDSSLAASITEAFRIDLGQSSVIRILSTAEISDALTRMQRDPSTPVTSALAREIAAREGAKAVVAGEISPLGKSFVLSARILSAEDGSELVALRETAADDAGIVAALDKLSGRVRERIGESLKTIRGGQRLDEVTTASLEALRLYSEAARLSDQGFPEQAIPMLQRAIALDSGFAMAWRKLAVALGNSRASEEQIVAATTRAYQHRDRLPEIERQLTAAYYYSAVDVDPAKEEAAYRQVLAIRPDNSVAVNNLSLRLLKIGRPAEAESLIAPAVRASPSPGNMYLQLVAAQLGQGHDDDARRTLDAMARQVPVVPNYRWGRAFALLTLGDYDGAEHAYVELGLSTREPSFQWLTRLGLQNVARTRGRLAEADKQGRLAIALSDRRGLPGTALAGAASLALQNLRFRGDTAAALRLLDEALRERPLDSVPPLDRPGAELAMVYAAAGERSRAHQVLAEYESHVPEGIRRGRWEWYQARGWLALADGRPREALTAFIQGRNADSCSACGAWDEGVAFERANLPDSALAAYLRAASRGTIFKAALADGWGLAPSLKRLGELYESRGDRQRALEYYGRFVELWKEADPALQPTVREVRARMVQLAGEGK